MTILSQGASIGKLTSRFIMGGSRKEPAQKRIEQIYAAALELFSRHGYHATTVDKIIEKAGISKGAFYWYFKSKEELFRSLFAHQIERLSQPLLYLLQGDRPAREKLSLAPKVSWDTCAANTGAVSLLMQLMAQTDLSDLVIYDYYKHGEQLLALFTGIFAEMGEDDPQGVAAVYMTMLDGLALQALSSQSFLDRGRLLGALDKIFLLKRRRGIGGQRARRPVAKGLDKKG